ncbi:protein BTG2-like [Dreissena polymorpha]|uniref:Anti-proliferative protein domain-containing protein n=1 Tax=Dreissena polymorpha TaxID=45954 RepID=A0A9D4JTB0_DREPO|nr:protein BTG2-like [Dreissena polymorpha]KAH3819888.1 hypothetical protein DPMN_121632 [Dreissena polymorpha]
MKEEIKSAVDFLTNILRSKNEINHDKSSQFNAVLQNILSARYQDHWFPEKPFKGSGFRCIRLNHNVDPLILQAGKICGLNHSILESTFPPELTIWVDPRDVSFRIGENGSVGILYQSENDPSEQYVQQTQAKQQEKCDLLASQSNHRTFSSTFMSCKEQFMNVFPSNLRESVHYQQLAGFIAS